MSYSSSINESRVLITCGMCLKEYGKNRVPKFLPCAHTFCQSCLTKIKKNTEIKCPICRKTHSIFEDVSTMPTNNYVEYLIIKLVDIETCERNAVVQSIELRKDIQASLFPLSKNAEKVETEMMKRLRKIKTLKIATEFEQSPFGSKLDIFLSELRILLNSAAPTRDELTTATEEVCGWLQGHKMGNKDYANLLIELESRMMTMEKREKECIFHFHDLKKDIKSLVSLSESVHISNDTITTQLENNVIFAMANLRKSESDIYWQVLSKLDNLFEERLSVLGESQDFQMKMEQYLAFVIRHSLSDEIVYTWIEKQYVYKASLRFLSNRDIFTAAPDENNEVVEITSVDLSNTPYRDMNELYSALIFALATASIDSAIEYKDSDFKLNREVLKRWASSILNKYIDESDCSGMQLIFVVHTLVTKLQHPKGLMQEIFEVLCEEGLLSWVIDPSDVNVPFTSESGFQYGRKLEAYLISDLISSYMAEKTLNGDNFDESNESEREIIL